VSAVVFCGPSVTPEDARAVLPEASFRGPAGCGDVYRAARERPRVIALCDGYFDHLPPVWHEEILWALSQGIRVYGASSMGALRAAELAPFGMIGVGVIFEQYRDGLLDSDDEVAVVHQSEAHGYRPLSEALVNIRATLARAAADGAIDAGSVPRWVALARRSFYPERSFEALLSRAASSELSSDETERLRRWLHAHGVVNQKRLDAFALLQRVQSDLRDDDRSRAEPLFELENTNAWHVLRTKLDHEQSPAAKPFIAAPRTRPAPASPRTALDVPPAVWADALERSLALLLADSSGVRPDTEEVQRESETFRGLRGLLSPEQTAAWLASNDLDPRDFSALIREEHLIRRFRARARALASAQIANALRLRGEYALEKPNIDSD